VEHEFVVKVELLNDRGERQSVVASAETIDKAVAAAERSANADENCDDWVMNEWRAL
jgi:hypothetical protein